jgi:predicted nucleic-acid-binding protein
MKTPGKTYLIDTNVILRFLLGDHDVFSKKSKTFMNDVESSLKKAEIHATVIVECIYVMEKYYKIPRAEIVDTLCGILTFSGIVNHDKKELITALIEYGNSNIDIVDCVLAAFSTPEKVIVSFDRDFKKLTCIYEQL